MLVTLLVACCTTQAPGSDLSNAPLRRRAPHGGPGHGKGTSSDQNQEKDPAMFQHLPGLIWVPDTYSLGPAPAAVAGAECVGSCFTVSNSKVNGVHIVLAWWWNQSDYRLDICANALQHTFEAGPPGV
jgi:hypothetical protein